MLRALTGVSTIPTPGGKAAGCGARTAIARPGSRKAARVQGRAPCTSSFAPIRWRTEVRAVFGAKATTLKESEVTYVDLSFAYVAPRVSIDCYRPVAAAGCRTGCAGA